jgi:hypothetical protein
MCASSFIFDMDMPRVDDAALQEYLRRRVMVWVDKQGRGAASTYRIRVVDSDDWLAEFESSREARAYIQRWRLRSLF